MPRILIVDDEEDLCEILSFNLVSEHFEVDCAFSAEQALSLLPQNSSDSFHSLYDLILLDVMMDRMSGFDLVRLLRSRGDNTPVIFLTARNEPNDILQGFNAGGDDYIRKPFAFTEVLARINAVLRRSSSSDSSSNSSSIVRGHLNIDTQRKVVYVDNQPVRLTKTEFNILLLLVRNEGRPFSRSEILDLVWTDDAFVNERSVDVHISRLRNKLGTASSSIHNQSGFGYLFSLS